MTWPSGPQPHPTSPAPPPGRHNLHIEDGEPIAVFCDTNVFFRIDFRSPLAASADAGDLAVYWSSAIRAEIGRVAHREGLAATSRSIRDQSSVVRERALKDAVPEIERRLEMLLAEAERRFLLAPVTPEHAPSDPQEIADPEDRRHVLSAQSVGASYLLSLDQRHLPHGSDFQGVQCWHPDTFLTLFYQQNPDAYARVQAFIQLLPAAITEPILPPKVRTQEPPGTRD